MHLIRPHGLLTMKRFQRVKLSRQPDVPRETQTLNPTRSGTRCRLTLTWRMPMNRSSRSYLTVVSVILVENLAGTVMSAIERQQGSACWLPMLRSRHCPHPRHGYALRGLATALGIALLMLACGCTSAVRTQLAQATTADTFEVYVQPPFGMPQRTKLAVLPFRAPPYADQAANVVTEAYYQELLRDGGFQQVSLLRELPFVQRQMPPWQALKDFDFVLQGEILYVLSGIGSSPTQLQVEVRIVDVSRGTMVSYLRQQCVSQPGKDVDLIWSTVPGEPARPYQEMAAVLARRFVQLITTMPETKPDTRQEPHPPGTPPSTNDRD